MALITSNQYHLVPEFMRRAARQADAADAERAAARAAAGKYSVIKCKSKSFKPKGSILYVPNTLQPKIFGSKFKSFNSKRFNFKSFNSNWLTLYVRNGFRRKIFGLKMGYL